MKRQPQLGLVAEGSSSNSNLLRLPKLGEELGPVKSRVLRVARRLSNMLRAGYAVSEYEELQAARLILLHVPDREVPRIVEELCASELVLKELAFALDESWLMMDALEPLRARGAAVATLVCVPTMHRDSFIVEGDAAAARQLRRFLERNEARALEIRPGTKPLYFAAELLAASLPVPLFAAAQEALRASGISGNNLSTLMDQMVQKMFRDFLKGSRVAWGGPLNQCSLETAGTYFEALSRCHPEIADTICGHLDWARDRMQRHKDSPNDFSHALSLTG